MVDEFFKASPIRAARRPMKQRSVSSLELSDTDTNDTDETSKTPLLHPNSSETLVIWDWDDTM